MEETPLGNNLVDHTPAEEEGRRLVLVGGIADIDAVVDSLSAQVAAVDSAGILLVVEAVDMAKADIGFAVRHSC